MGQTSNPFVAANQDLLQSAAAMGERYSRTPAEMLATTRQAWAINVAATNLLAEAQQSADGAEGAEGAEGQRVEEIWW